MTNGGRYKPRKILNLECWGCEKPFQATRPDARYCTPTCRKQASRLSSTVRRLKFDLRSTAKQLDAAKIQEKKKQAGKGRAAQ